MSNFTDFAGGGGGTPYKGSTAEAVYAPVSEGTFYNLNLNGNLLPNTTLLSETDLLNQATLSQANGGNSGGPGAGPFVCGQYEGQMPNGNILYPFQNYVDITNARIGFVVLNSSGEQLSYAGAADAGAFYYANTYYNLESMGENSTHYIFTVFTKGQNSANNIGYVRGYILTVRKSDNVITIYPNANLVTTLNTTTVPLADELGGSLQLARDRSVYCALRMVGGTSLIDTAYEISSGTVSAAYAQVEQTTTTLPNVYTPRNIQLIKYDDSSANFLLVHAAPVNGPTGYVVKKVLVAADGTHTVTDITPVALSQGSGSTQQDARYIRLYKSEDISKFLFLSVPNNYEARYQKASYDGSTITVDSFQKYLTPTTASADWLFPQDETNWNRTFNANSLIYRYTEDKLYLAPRATAGVWSGNIKGAVWTLGSGDATGTAVKTDIFDLFLSEGSMATRSLISIDSDGIITERFNSNSSYVLGQNGLALYNLPATQDKIAYVRQSGDIGDTVNISLIEGVTSKDTLSSTYWLNKEGMYYAFDNAETTAPAFSYLKLLSNNTATVAAATINARAEGDDALFIRAPQGKYLIVYRYESTTASNNADSTGVRVDGNSIQTSIKAAEINGAFDSNTSARLDTYNTPIICKSFSFYRSSAGTEDTNTALYYYIGEPA